MTDLRDEASRETDDLECSLELVEGLSFIHTLPTDKTLQVPVLIDCTELQVNFLLACDSRDEVIEHMEVALAGTGCLRNSRSLEIVLDSLETSKPASIGELQLGIIAEPGGIIVGQGVSVAERFEDKLGDKHHPVVTHLPRRWRSEVRSSSFSSLDSLR